jgi:protocatechuate 3,4-dioxygenase, beta subunit
MGDETPAAAPLQPVDPAALEPPYDYPAYRSTAKRAPRQAVLALPPGLAATTGPVFGESVVGPLDHDLTRQHAGAPLGERIIVFGRLVDGDGRPVRRQLIEVWQANAAGRYAHSVDRHEAPLDPNFTGYGRCLTGDDGSFEFVSIRPGEYPWQNHENAWRPAHIHFSVFGTVFTERLVTQMYFPGDPLLEIDPIFHSVASPNGRARLVARFDLEHTVPMWALAYRFDIVLGGRQPTPTKR